MSLDVQGHHPSRSIPHNWTAKIPICPRQTFQELAWDMSLHVPARLNRHKQLLLPWMRSKKSRIGLPQVKTSVHIAVGWYLSPPWREGEVGNILAWQRRLWKILYYYSYWYISNKQRQNFFEKCVLNQICGFFQHFLALFKTFTTLYYDPCIRFEFSG